MSADPHWAAVVDQLRDELTARLVLPLSELAGGDLHALLAPRVAAASEQAALALVDPSAAPGAARTVMYALWGQSDIPGSWWQTPAGALVAGAMASDATGERVTHAQAAAMLGVTRGTIAQLTSRGTLERHPDGGVDLASVLNRIARRHGQPGRIEEDRATSPMR